MVPASFSFFLSSSLFRFGPSIAFLVSFCFLHLGGAGRSWVDGWGLVSRSPGTEDMGENQKGAGKICRVRDRWPCHYLGARRRRMGVFFRGTQRRVQSSVGLLNHCFLREGLSSPHLCHTILLTFRFSFVVCFVCPGMKNEFDDTTVQLVARRPYPFPSVNSKRRGFYNPYSFLLLRPILRSLGVTFEVISKFCRL